jgi:hypothetical protein
LGVAALGGPPGLAPGVAWTALDTYAQGTHYVPSFGPDAIHEINGWRAWHAKAVDNREWGIIDLERQQPGISYDDAVEWYDSMEMIRKYEAGEEMNVEAKASGALGCLFVKCSGFGFLDDASTRRYKASLFVAMWIMAALFSIVSTFSFWIYNLHGVYHELWPFRNSGSKVAGLGALIILGVPALIVAIRIGRKYARYARIKATFREGLVLGMWYIAVILSIGANMNKYGSLAALFLHLAFVAWLLRESRRHVLA